MEREHQTEWLGLRTEAGEILRKGFPEKPRDRRVFQLVVLPSFEESYSWELYERETGSDTVEAIALRAVWHLREDLSKFDPLARRKLPRKLSPTITVKAGRIDGALAAELIGELSEIAVPLGPCNDGISLDGTSYELTVGTGSTQSRLAWHNDGPPYWNAVRRWTLRIVSKLEDALQTCNSRFVGQPPKFVLALAHASRRTARRRFEPLLYGKELLEQLLRQRQPLRGESDGFSFRCWI